MTRVTLVIGICFLVLVLYSIANTSDRIEPLTAKQQAEIVGLW